MQDSNHPEGFKNPDVHDHNQLVFANDQLHQASQFLAIIGKNLIPQKPDDSNTNIGIIAAGLISHQIQGSGSLYALLDIPGFTLNLIDPEMHRIWTTELDGKSRTEILNELKAAINASGFDGNGLKHIEHYKMEKEHPIQKGAPFEKPDKDALCSWHAMYSNARIVLSEVSRSFPMADEVRIWPHHFDIGSYMPLDETGTKSIGIGLAVPDSVVNDFYYYIYGWQKDKTFDMNSFAGLTTGEWRSGYWNGAVLPISQLSGYDSGVQKQKTLQFFKESKEEYLKALN